MPAGSSDLLDSWDVLPGLDAPLDVVQDLIAIADDRIRADLELEPYERVLMAFRCSAEYYGWLATALVDDAYSRAMVLSSRWLP